MEKDRKIKCFGPEKKKISANRTSVAAELKIKFHNKALV